MTFTVKLKPAFNDCSKMNDEQSGESYLIDQKFKGIRETMCVAQILQHWKKCV